MEDIPVEKASPCFRVCCMHIESSKFIQCCFAVFNLSSMELRLSVTFALQEKIGRLLRDIAARQSWRSLTVSRLEAREKSVSGCADSGIATSASCLVVLSIKSFASTSRCLSEDRTSIFQDLGSLWFEAGGNELDDDNPLEEKGDEGLVGDEDEFQDHSLPPGFSTKHVMEPRSLPGYFSSLQINGLLCTTSMVLFHLYLFQGDTYALPLSLRRIFASSLPLSVKMRASEIPQ